MLRLNDTDWEASCLAPRTRRDGMRCRDCPSTRKITRGSSLQRECPRRTAPTCQVVRVKELAQRCARAPHHHLLGPRLLGLVEAPHERRQHMRVLRVEVVVGAIQVGGHSGDGIPAVLHSTHPQPGSGVSGYYTELPCSTSNPRCRRGSGVPSVQKLVMQASTHAS